MRVNFLWTECRTDNAAKNRWATINKRQQLCSAISTLSSASNATHNAASDPPQAESASALQTAPLTTDTATTQTEPGSVPTPPSAEDNLASLKAKPSTTVSSQVSDSPQQVKCRSGGDASPHQSKDNASSAAAAGLSSRRLAHMASMRSINSRHRAAVSTAAAQSVTVDLSAPVPITVSTDSAALLERPTGLLCSCGLSQPPPVVQIDSYCPAQQPMHQTLQIESYCPAYQSKSQTPQGMPSVQGRMQCTTAEAIEKDQSPVQPAQLILQGPGQEAPQGLAKLPSSDETAQVCQAGPCNPADPEVQVLESAQGFLPSATPLSLTSCSATCLAYLAGVLDERRREKDPTVQMHIDRAWQQLQLLLAG